MSPLRKRDGLRRCIKVLWSKFSEHNMVYTGKTCMRCILSFSASSKQVWILKTLVNR